MLNIKEKNSLCIIFKDKKYKIYKKNIIGKCQYDRYIINL